MIIIKKENKKEKDKEELLKMLEEISNSEDVSEDTKEKIKDLSNKIENFKVFTKKDYILAYIILILSKLVFVYTIALILVGLFADFLVIENKMYIFLIPLGVSLLFSTLSIVNHILSIRISLSYNIFKILFVMAVFIGLNMMYPIFEFNVIWIFYIGIIVFFEEYFTYKFIRRKLWNEKSY